eukprot:TRINITY_DN23922_c0_g2_i1.p1 TRINITY_DN23922_c0_g2~~TRINITY_DN23922_c0_g2_i1.p1  ORF type:complete len:336 (+),score=78.60 TRINITY_DN23922_c0_g2_i1:38-1009(+)
MAESESLQYVIVKNTCLHCDEGPRPPVLQRCYSTPAKLEGDSEDEVQAPPEGEDVNESPEVPELYRILTEDGYEPLNNWSELCGLQQMPVAGGYRMPDGMATQPGVVAVMPAPMLQQGETSSLAADAEPTDLPTPAPEPPTVPEVARPEAPRPPVLNQVFSVASTVYRVHWAVEARVLKSKDREKASPPFDLSVGGVSCQFKMFIAADQVSDKRFEHCFKKAKGKGTVLLKCVSAVDSAANCSMNFRFVSGFGRGAASAASATSAGTTDGGAAAAAPQISDKIGHDFAQQASCGPPDKYDFSAVVDEASQTFVICLEVFPLNQ